MLRSRKESQCEACDVSPGTFLPPCHSCETCEPRALFKLASCDLLQQGPPPTPPPLPALWFLLQLFCQFDPHRSLSEQHCQGSLGPFAESCCSRLKLSV